MRTLPRTTSHAKAAHPYPAEDLPDLPFVPALHRQCGIADVAARWARRSLTLRPYEIPARLPAAPPSAKDRHRGLVLSSRSTTANCSRAVSREASTRWASMIICYVRLMQRARLRGSRRPEAVATDPLPRSGSAPSRNSPPVLAAPTATNTRKAPTQDESWPGEGARDAGNGPPLAWSVKTALHDET